MMRLKRLQAMGLIAMNNEGGEGGGGDGDAAAAASAAAAAAGQGAPSPADIAARAAAAAAAKGGKGDEGEGDGDDSPWTDPKKAQAEIERLRRERGDERIAAKQQAADEARKDLLQTLTKALGGEVEGETPTVEGLSKTLETVTSERDRAHVDKGVVLEAWQQGVDPARLEYLQFMLTKRADFGKISAADENLGATLKTMISEEIAKDSSLKAPGAARGSGDTQFGGAGDAKTYTAEQFKQMSLAERTELFRTNRAEYDRLVALK